MNLCTYSPQISPGNPYIVPPPASPPTIVQVETVTFTYPFGTPTLSLTLPAPELNNRHTFRIERITRETRGGTLKTFRYEMWPKIHKLAIAFEGVKDADAESFKNFLRNSLGGLIGYLDFESRLWRGLILNPDTAISQEGKDKRTFTVKVDFEGDLV